MTVYAPRAPLQLIQNPHIMSQAQGHGRRHSSRLAEKEDNLPNGLGQHYEPVKQKQKTSATERGGKVSNTNKRKPTYDEEDDGFAFTRTRSKKAKAQPVQPLIIEEQEKEPEPPARKKQKKLEVRPTAPIASQQSEQSTRRSTRNSAGNEGEPDPPTLAVKKRRKKNSNEAQQTPATSPKKNRHASQRQEPEDDHTHPVDIQTDSTKIALPFADTPIIRRNQEMRRGTIGGSRRSSLGMRGRRASSLIDAGKSNALPHDEVQTNEFYKHIESEGLSEPRRMKQLLTWCGTRAMVGKPPISGKDRDAALAAREIQSQLLKDFSTKSSLSDWFSREDEPVLPSPPKPNPKNAANQIKIKELEAQLAHLKLQREAFNSLLNPPSLAPLPPNPTSAPQPSEIDSSLLPPSQHDILSSLLPRSEGQSTSDTVAPRVATIVSKLEPTIDEFATSIHALSSYKNVASSLADEILGDCAKILDLRDREGTRRANIPGGQSGEGSEGQEKQGEAGLRPVLRELSRVIER